MAKKMAKSVALLELTVMLIAVLTMASLVHSQREERILNRLSRTFTLYFQPTIGGPNATLIPVAGPNGGPGAFGIFGSLFVSDIPVTRGISRDSPIVARAQGIAVESSLNRTERFLSFSLLFLEGELKDSTLQFQGLLRLSPSGNFAEISVTSGTNDFRYAKGFAVITTVVQNATTNATVAKYDITLKFDD